MGTPFVALEYRPKLLDFARSIDSEEQVVRTDQMGRLDRVVEATLSRRSEIAGHIAQQVRPLAARQEAVAAAIAAELGASS